MDALDEINAKIEELCAIAERERDRALDGLVEYTTPAWGGIRNDLAELALAYAEWTRSLEGYRALLRGREGKIARIER